MNEVALGSVCLINPRTPKDLDPADSCSFVPMEAVDDYLGAIVGAGARQVSEVGTGYTFFAEGDVLFAKITPCMENGKCAMARGLAGGIGFGSTEFHVVRPGPSALAEWVYYFLRQEATRRKAVGSMTGSAGQRRVPARFLEEAVVPLPALAEQRRISAVLAKADRVRRLRRWALELSEGYLQAVFLEMFGDPRHNPRGWRASPLRSLSHVFSDGPFGSNLKSEHYTTTGVRVIRLQNIGVGRFVDDDKAYISEEYFAALSKHRCLPGDVIVGTLGDPNLRACILPDSIPVALNKADCIQIRVNEAKVVAQYVCWLLNMPETLQLAASMIHGQTRERINMGRLAVLEIPVPPIGLQMRFARVAGRYALLRRQEREALRQAERLFETLLHRAFLGEL